MVIKRRKTVETLFGKIEGAVSALVKVDLHMKGKKRSLLNRHLQKPLRIPRAVRFYGDDEVIEEMDLSKDVFYVKILWEDEEFPEKVGIGSLTANQVMLAGSGTTVTSLSQILHDFFGFSVGLCPDETYEDLRSDLAKSWDLSS